MTRIISRNVLAPTREGFDPDKFEGAYISLMEEPLVNKVHINHKGFIAVHEHTGESDVQIEKRIARLTRSVLA